MNIYAGTSSGLYELVVPSYGNSSFRAIKGIDASAVVMKERHGIRLAGTASGLFEITGTSAKKISNGVVYDVSFSESDPKVVYAAGTEGMVALRLNGSTWTQIARVPGPEFRTVLEIEKGRVWVTCRSEILRIDYAAEPKKIERFRTSRGAPEGWINVFKFQGHPVFATSKGLLQFSESEGRFVADPELGLEFSNGGKSVSQLAVNANHDVLITGTDYNTYLEGLPLAKRERIENPMLGLLPGELYGLFLDDDGTAWGSGSDGVLYRWNPIRKHVMPELKVLIRRVMSGNGTTISSTRSGVSNQAAQVSDHTVRFEFAAPFYADQEGIQYQTRLDGYEANWSKWTNEAAREFYDLSEHNHEFHVRAKNARGQLSPEAVYMFRILQPWYRTWWAYGSYVLAILGLTRLFQRWRQLKAVQSENVRLEAMVAQRTAEIRAERDQNEALLLNILPAAVAFELRRNGSVKPTLFEDVTVCFSDFREFTSSSARVSPDELVSALNEYFTAFDGVMEKYGLEKLKTIGDSYMFASGLPEPSPSHALNAVLGAFEMMQIVKRLNREGKATSWQMRIGLYSGPVIAGVVGKRKFAFDIWGNTVNLASRMESSGVPERVNLSATTHHCVRDFIQCEPRGDIHIKGGQELEMHFALAPLPELIEGPLKDGIPLAFREKYEATFGHSPKSFPEFMLLKESCKPSARSKAV